MSHQLVRTIVKPNNTVSRILVAVDDSGHITQTLRYVGTLLRDTPDVHVMLFHVLG